MEPVRVAVIGGGCAAMTTAFELTRPEHNGRYQVTVYQMGWRLGGKGASGRGVANRIEEHGLHLWMGFYENAFRLMRDCYAERHAAYPHHRFADWREAFAPAPDVGVADRTENGWDFWLAHFPPGQGEPGDPSTRSDPFTVLAYLRQSVMLIGELLRSASVIESGMAGKTADPGCGPVGRDAISAAIDRLCRQGELVTAAAILEASQILRQGVDMLFPQMYRDNDVLPSRMLEALAAAARHRLERLVTTDGELRRIWQVIDLILAILRGAVRHGLAFDTRLRRDQ